MKLKRLKLSSLFFIIFIIFLGLLFLFLFKNSTDKYSKIRFFAHEILSKQIIKMTIDSSSERLNQEASYINQQIMDAIDSADNIGSMIKILYSEELTPKSKNKLDLQATKLIIDQKSDKARYYSKNYFSYIDYDNSKTSKSETKAGFFAAALGKTGRLDKEQQTAIDKLLLISPTFKKLVTSDKTSYFNAGVILKENVGAGYSLNPVSQLISLSKAGNSVIDFAKVKELFSSSSQTKVWSTKRQNILNDVTIHVASPIYNSNNKLVGVAYIDLAYSLLKNKWKFKYTDYLQRPPFR